MKVYIIKVTPEAAKLLLLRTGRLRETFYSVKCLLGK